MIQPDYGPEPRQEERIRVRLRVRYGMNAMENEAYTENVSEAGVYIRTNKPYKVGTRLRLRIEFPEQSVFIRGEVVWAIQVPDHLRHHMECGMGVTFLETDAVWRNFFSTWRQRLQADGGG